MKSNGRRIVAAVLISTGTLALSGCRTTGEGKFDINKLAFWKSDVTVEEEAEAERKAEEAEKARIKEEIRLKVLAELKAENEAKKAKADKTESVEELKERMRLEIIAEMKAEEKAKLEAKLLGEKLEKEKAEELKRKEEDKKKREFSDLSKEEQAAVRRLSEKFAKNFIESVDDEDYDDFIKDMAPSLVKNLNKKKFNYFVTQVKKAKGEFGRFSYLGELKTGVFVTLVYKVESKKEKGEKVIVEESLLRLALAKLDGKYMIWSFSLD